MIGLELNGERKGWNEHNEKKKKPVTARRTLKTKVRNKATEEKTRTEKKDNDDSSLSSSISTNRCEYILYYYLN